MALMTKNSDAADLYERMRWNTPLSEEHAALLLTRLEVAEATTVLDLGCGWGELLLRAMALTDSAQGIGVDSDSGLLRRGEAAAAERGLGRRVRFVCQPAADWSSPADRLICIGASHAWAGVDAMLNGLYELAPSGARLLCGEGCWERPPTKAAASMFHDVLTLTAIVEQAREAGWRVLSLTAADQHEWDNFESTWHASREAPLLGDPDSPGAIDERRRLDQRLDEYIEIYRGVLGFAYLVLARP